MQYIETCIQFIKYIDVMNAKDAFADIGKSLVSI